jgi:ABC-2 type transport system ATP-binding protein
VSILDRHSAKLAGQSVISCSQLTKRFGKVTAVNSLSLEVAKGTICAFLGPNGAGKSTTVKMLSGLLAPTSGTATVCGFDVAAHPIEVKRRIGVLPESLGLFDDLTIGEHLLLTAQVYGLSRQQAHERIEQLLRVLSLTGGRHTFAAQGSHGMRKKTAFAMALLPNPEVLFLDEPFEAIDPATSKVMRELLVSAAARGITVFLTSHILPEVERIAHRFIMIREGTIVWNSPAAELTGSLEELYLELAEPPASEQLEWLASGQS